MYVKTVCDVIFRQRRPLRPLLEFHAVRDEAFARFWVEFSIPASERGTATAMSKGEHAEKETETEPTMPDPSQLVGSAALVPPLLLRAKGIVLDVGPGTGTQMPFLAAAEKKNGIRAIFGAEPCIGLHEDLRRKAATWRLQDKYHVGPWAVDGKDSTVQALVKAVRQHQRNSKEEEERSTDATVGVFDTIVCVRVLCSVPHPELSVAMLYDLLKPGGELLVVEHTVNPYSFTRSQGSLLARLLQGLYQLLGWSFFIGDCHMNRNTEKYLLQAAQKDGGWAKVDLQRKWLWSTMPYIAGSLVKK